MFQYQYQKNAFFVTIIEWKVSVPVTLDLSGNVSYDADSKLDGIKKG